MSNNGLGRGLNSLIPQKNNRSSNVGGAGTQNVIPGKDLSARVPIDKIRVNSMQPRQTFSDHSLDELVASIKEYDIIQPLVVSPQADGTYELIAGERRLRAAKKAGLTDVPVIRRKVTDQQKLEVALTENIQREDLNPIELSMAYKKLMDQFDLTQDELAKRVGKSRSSVANTMRLTQLPEEIQMALIDGRLTEGHAKFLLGLDSEAKQLKLFRKILHNNMSVADTNQEAKRMGGTKKARIQINYADKDKEFALREFFGARVEINRKGRGGQVLIDFFSDEELDEIIGKVRK